jgi:hypothetical protein
VCGEVVWHVQCMRGVFVQVYDAWRGALHAGALVEFPQENKMVSDAWRSTCG